MPHNPLGPICTAANIHLAAAIPNFAWLEERLYPRRGARPGDNINVLLDFADADHDGTGGSGVLASGQHKLLAENRATSHATSGGAKR